MLSKEWYTEKCLFSCTVLWFNAVFFIYDIFCPIHHFHCHRLDVPCILKKCIAFIVNKHSAKKNTHIWSRWYSLSLFNTISRIVLHPPYMYIREKLRLVSHLKTVTSISKQVKITENCRYMYGMSTISLWFFPG